MARQRMLSRMVRVKAKNLDAWIAGLSEEEKERLRSEWLEFVKGIREAIEEWTRVAIPIVVEAAKNIREAFGPPMASNGGPKPKEERNTQENPSTPAE
jgi:hypothetical protein